MTEPSKKNLNKQVSLSYIEQSLKMISSPQQAPVTIYPGPKANLQNLSKADLEIADRLAKLRRSSTELPSEEEMAARLAQLKGLPLDHYSKPSVIYHPPDNRSQSEKSDDLLKQVMDEVTLEQTLPNQDEEIEARLANLRGISKQNVRPQSENKTSDFQGVPTTECKDLAAEITESVKDLRKELASLNEDPEITAAISKACREVNENKSKKNKKKHSCSKKRPDSSSDEEKFSASESKYTVKSLSCEEAKKESEETKKETEETKKETEEVERIVKMYTEKAKLKKEKKKRRKLLEGGKSPELSSESDLSSSESDILTSESEKISVSESD